MLTWSRNDLANAARLLSRDHTDVVSRRHAENLLATTPDAVWLYRVREIQFAVTIAETLRTHPEGTHPEDANDLWMPWLDLRRPDSELAAWRAFDESLVDAVVAVDRWWNAGHLFQDLLMTPSEVREELIREDLSHESSTCDVVLVMFCLAVEEQQRTLGGAEGADAAWLGVQVADHLLDRYKPPLNGSVLADRLALSWARLSNAYRILGRIPDANKAMNSARVVGETFKLVPWVAAEVASLHASLLKDEGLDLELAEKRTDEAIRIFSGFDVHLAAKTLVGKAEIQRMRRDKSYLSTLEQALQHVDACRDVHTAEVASTNLLVYSIREGRSRDATMQRHTLPIPTLPAQAARRLCAEGCLELMLGRPELALAPLRDAALRFTALSRFFDGVLALLYLALTCQLLHRFREGREHLATAHHLALASGHPVSDAIERLTRVSDVTDLPARIQQVAFDAGGCLSSLGAEATD